MGSSNLHEQEEGYKSHAIPKGGMPSTPPSDVAKEDMQKKEEKHSPIRQTQEQRKTMDKIAVTKE